MLDRVEGVEGDAGRPISRLDLRRPEVRTVSISVLERPEGPICTEKAGGAGSPRVPEKQLSNDFVGMK